MNSASRMLLVTLLCAFPIGCRNTAPPIGTGARAVVANYFEALAKEDWATAHAQLHSDTQKRFAYAQFELVAQAYCKQLGFPIGKVHIRSCDEQGDQAIAQIILTDTAGAAKNRYHEGAILQKEAAGWRIVLPDNFGAARP